MDSAAAQVMMISVIETWLKKLEEKDDNFFFGNLKNASIISKFSVDTETIFYIKLHYVKKNTPEP